MPNATFLVDPVPAPFRCFLELDLNALNTYNYAVYVIDYNWVYLFVNNFAKKRMGHINIIGKHIEKVWTEFPEANFKPVYNLLRDSVDSKTTIQFKSKSPITSKTIHLRGYPLHDCYYFIVSELPDKEALITELRSFLKKSN